MPKGNPAPRKREPFYKDSYKIKALKSSPRGDKKFIRKKLAELFKVRPETQRFEMLYIVYKAKTVGAAQKAWKKFLETKGIAYYRFDRWAFDWLIERKIIEVSLPSGEKVTPKRTVEA